MTAITNIVQDAFYDASAPLQVGQIADSGSINAMRANGGGDFSLDDVVAVGSFVVKGSAHKYPDSHMMQPYAVKPPATGAVEADFVGVVVSDVTAFTNPIDGRPSVGHVGNRMASVAKIGSGVVIGVRLTGTAAVDGGNVHVVVVEHDDHKVGDVMAAASGANTVELTNVKFYGASNAGVARIKL